MHLIFLATSLVCVLSPWLHPSLASSVTQRVEDKVERGTVSAVLKQQATAAPATDNITQHAAEHTITYPSRLIYYLNEDSESTHHDLNTRAKNQAKADQTIHLAQASFQLEAFGTRFVLDLTLNNDLLSSDYVEIHYENGKPVQSKGGEHCYYHGQVRGSSHSHVALSTCNGLHGMFDDGIHAYLIEPLHQAHLIDSAARPHKIKRAASILSDHGSEELVDEDEEEEDLFSELNELSWLRRRKKRAMPRNIFEEMKYLEIMIVSDHSMYKRHKNRQHTRNFAKSVVNLVDGIFKDQLHTRVVLVALEIWTDKDQIPIGVMPLEILRDFSKYRQQSIKLHADSVQLLSNVTFHYRRSNAAYFGGMCSVSRGVGVNEYGTTWAMVVSLSQSLAQNLGIQWDPASKRKDCGCAGSWSGCIMEDTGVQHPQRFSKCSISDYREFLLKGGGSCLFNRPTKLFDVAHCGNGYIEVGEECDCGLRSDCHKGCCKKCSLANGAHCSDGPCCNVTCLLYPRGYSCREAVNDCDISETCTGDSGQCPANLHKQDGYMCQVNQGRCYSGECKTRENQCKYIWGSKAGGSEKFCYEKLNTEGTEKGNCGKDGDRWIQCSKHDVFCGYLLCTNVGRTPRIGMMKGDFTLTSFNHQGNVIQCYGAHVLLDDDTDLGYVEDGTPCGPSMMCLDHKCLPIQSLNVSTCPIGPNGQVCSAHGVCNNEATCTCYATWAGTDCSMPDPPKEPDITPTEEPKVSVATNRLIGAVAGTILALGVIFGGTGWGIENVKKRRYDPNAQAI
ncbi:PREDICTED: disintegrin and metalloproteinase domain-containing protein 23 isoform X2 [Cyprinodon variegatus]|uniref:ADAM metallopeptidase domain 23 n=1 Tax=Cyprinodon variegatus TaxID=28743 RepID=A0A3Q2G9R9_CYPVA|nr:PREDICTED: disintegrin and metalloproteinase domain-containing protein 23 isoform X2 [Cyprinodon variegatus]